MQSLKEIVHMKYIFGYRGDFKNNVFQHQDPNKVIYPAGHNIIIYNTENKQQQFLQGQSGTQKISCMTVSQSKRYLAWTEQTEATGLIIIQDLNSSKRKILSSIEAGSSHYICLQFNPKEEHKQLVSLSGSPDYSLIFWDWSKAKSIANIKISLSNSNLCQVFYSQKEDDLVCVYGQNYIKLMKVTQDGQVKPKDIQFNKGVNKDNKETSISQNFLSHCFLKDENLIIGTEQGEIYYFNNNFEIKSVLQSSLYDNIGIDCLMPFSKGFLVGASNGTIYTFEKKNDMDPKNPFIRSEKKYQNREIKGKIQSMIMTNGEENIMLGLNNGQLLQLTITQGEESFKLENLVQNFHCAEITGLDVCIKKALIATCSLDKTVKIWNYLEHTLECWQEFDEQALSLAFHNSGLNLVVAFSTKIKMLNIYEKEFVELKEIPIKNCKEIKFAHGGHLFAVANNNIIQVFQTYTGENPPQYIFKNHTTKVKSIYWHDDDLGFYSVSKDGVVFDFKLDERESMKQPLMQLNHFQPSCIISHQNQSLFFGGKSLDHKTSDENKCILQVNLAQQQQQKDKSDNKQHLNQEPLKIFTGQNVNQIQLSMSSKFFFFGTKEKTSPGALRVSRYPFGEEILDLQTHSKGLKKIRVTFDDSYLFTAGMDGILIIYEIRDKEGKLKRDKDGVGVNFSEEFLISKKDYLKKIKKIEDLQLQIVELSKKNELKNLLKIKQRDQDIAQLQDQIQVQNEQELKKLEEKQILRKELQQKYDQKKQKMLEEFEQSRQMLEKGYNIKMSLEASRFDELQKNKEKEISQYNQDIITFEELHQQELEKQMEYYQNLLSKEKTMREEIFYFKSSLIEEYNIKRNKLEEEAEKEIEELKDVNQDKLEKIRIQMDSSDAQKKLKKAQYENDTQEVEEQRAKLKEILENIQETQEKNKQLNKEKEMHSKELEERQKTINDKSSRIFELKKKTEELEKFKFVLDYKIKELKRDIGPREEEIAKMMEQISNMNSEIMHFKRTNANLSLIVTDLNLRQKGMKKEIEELNRVISENDSYQNSYETDLSEMYACIKDYKNLKKKMLKLYSKYVQNDSKKFEANVDIQAEFINQRGHLETNVKSLLEKFKKNMEAHKKDNQRIMKENVDLIKEINDLKREKKLLKEELAIRLKPISQNGGKNNLVQQQIDIIDKQIDENQQRMEDFQNQIDEYTIEIENIKNVRSQSQKKLPPIQAI